MAAWTTSEFFAVVGWTIGWIGTVLGILGFLYEWRARRLDRLESSAREARLEAEIRYLRESIRGSIGRGEGAVEPASASTTEAVLTWLRRTQNGAGLVELASLRSEFLGRGLRRVELQSALEQLENDQHVELVGVEVRVN